MLNVLLLELFFQLDQIVSKFQFEIESCVYLFAAYYLCKGSANRFSAQYIPLN